MNMTANICVVGLVGLAWMAAARAGTAEPDAQRACEARGLWAHPEQVIAPDPEKGRKDIEALVGRMAAANLNLLLPWVRSEYMAALLDPEFPKDNAFAKLASWDALGELIKTAHQRGIETHVWYSFTYYKSALSHEMRKHPEWAAHRLDEFVPDPKTGKTHPPWMTDVCNLHPGARQLELDLVKLMLDRYPLVRGVHIEEPGFGYPGTCFCDLCNQTFRMIYGFDQKEKPDGPEAADLKCLATTDFMRRLRATMLDRDPSLVLSANGGYAWQGERRSGRDWHRWAHLGWLHYYVPQIYTHDFDALRSRAAETLAALRPRAKVSVGINISPSTIRPKRFTPDELVKAVHAIRETGAEGIVFFWAGIFTDEDAQALRAGPFAQPARLPFVSYRTDAAANLIQNPGFEDGLKGWSASPHASVVEADAAEGKRCLKLVGTSAKDSKAGYQVKLAEPVVCLVKLGFKAKRLEARNPNANVGISVEFRFADGTWTWFQEPWRVAPTEAGKWVAKNGFYKSEKPLTSIGVWCINYESAEPAFFDDVDLRVFPEKK